MWRNGVVQAMATERIPRPRTEYVQSFSDLRLIAAGVSLRARRPRHGLSDKQLETRLAAAAGAKRCGLAGWLAGSARCPPAWGLRLPRVGLVIGQTKQEDELGVSAWCVRGMQALWLNVNLRLCIEIVRAAEAKLIKKRRTM